MDFRTELAKWGYNRGNSIDVETLINEILPSLSSKQDKNLYSEEELINALHSVELRDNKDYSKIYSGMKEWFEHYKNK